MSPMMRTLATMLFELFKICAISGLIATASAVLREALKEAERRGGREPSYGDARPFGAYIIPSRRALP